MKHYKFIGTEQDLKSNGFYKQLNMYNRNLTSSWGWVHIIGNKVAMSFALTEITYKWYDGVGGNIKYIHDLIDKGLVVKINDRNNI